MSIEIRPVAAHPRTLSCLRDKSAASCPWRTRRRQRHRRRRRSFVLASSYCTPIPYSISASGQRSTNAQVRKGRQQKALRAKAPVHCAMDVHGGIGFVRRKIPQLCRCGCVWPRCMFEGPITTFQRQIARAGRGRGRTVGM